MQEITLMETYLIEILRQAKVADEDILAHVRENRVDAFQKYHESFDFNGLYQIENLEDVLERGYKIKFLTMPGLVNLLGMKYGKKEGQDFVKKETSIEKLQLTKEQKEDLEGWLANNWQVKAVEDIISIVPRFVE